MQIRVKKPKGVLLKIFRVLVSTKFRQTLDNYFEYNVSNYLINHWRDKKIVNLVNKIRNESSDALRSDISVPQIPENGNNVNEIIDSIKLYVSYVKKNKIKVSSVYDLIHLVWGEGYNQYEIQVPFFEDVSNVLKQWKSDNIKIYTISSGTVEGQSTYFTHSSLGDLSFLVDGYVSTHKPAMDKTHSSTYEKVAEIMNEKPNDIIFFTDKTKEVKASMASDMQSIRVSRNHQDFSRNTVQGLSVIKSLHEIIFI